jgi:pimeloyl-ACP methyl ester carboxylesterase
LPVALLLRDRYPSIGRAPRIQCPVLVIAGTRDRVIPVEHTHRLYDAIVASKTFVEISADHNDAALLDGMEMMNAIIGFIGKAPRTSQ